MCLRRVRQQLECFPDFLISTMLKLTYHYLFENVSNDTILSNEEILKYNEKILSLSNEDYDLDKTDYDIASLINNYTLPNKHFVLL